MPAKQIPLHQPIMVPYKLLEFDRKNPRFAGELGGKLPDQEIINYFNERSDLLELVQSITSSTYIQIEPLVVLSEGESLTVLEGNRRLAAIKLLHDPGLAKKCGITIPTISEKVRASIQEINVYRVESREEARDFIGFKHINGPHKWESFAKARFAADWYKQEKRNKGGLTLHDIAQRMGDRHDTIQRMVSAIFVLDQAAEKKIFEINDRYPSKIFSFSHLYTALTRTGFRSFLGVSDEWKAEEPEPNPIPEDKVSNLNKVLIWIYGSKDSDIQPIVTSQNPHVKQLGQVLENSRARAILLKQGKLEIAFAELEPPGQQFEKNLVEARHYIEEAQRKVESYDGKDATLLQIAEEVTKKSQLIFNVMQQQRKSGSK